MYGMSGMGKGLMERGSDAGLWSAQTGCWWDSCSPDVLLGEVGTSDQAGDQVCKAGMPQGEGLCGTPTAPSSPWGTPISVPFPTKSCSRGGFFPLGLQEQGTVSLWSQCCLQQSLILWPQLSWGCQV